MRRDSLIKLQQLVDDLSDRDEQLKRDVSAFNDFFEHFPVPITVWSTNRNGDVLTCKGNAIPCVDSGKSIDGLFVCAHFTHHVVTGHASAMEGNVVSFMIESGDPVYYVHLVPQKTNEGSVTGVVGLAWDITTNVSMLGHATNALSLLREGNVEEGVNLLKEAVKSSRLKSLIESGIEMYQMPEQEDL